MQTEQQRFDDGLREVFDAGSGVMTLVVLTARSSRSLVCDAIDGDATAKTVLAAADQLLRRIHRRSAGTALPCMLCDRNPLCRSEPPGAVAVLLPFGIVPVRNAVGLAICTDCTEARIGSALANAVVAQLRDGALPDLRALPALAQAGHA